MKSKYTLTELKALYLGAEFVEKVKPISKTPIKAIEYLYKGLKKSFEDKYEDLGGSEEDPLNVLSLLERAENGEDAVIALILSNITKTDTVDEVVEYWGDKAIEFHCATSCLLYANLLGMDEARHDKKFPAARWGCTTDNQEIKMMAKLLFVGLSMQHPEAYESRISFIETNTEESELKKLLDESLKHKDYSIYFLIVLIYREKGQKIDLVKLKEICADADVESFYYFLANEKIPETEEFNFNRQYNDCLEMNRIAKQVLDNAQREVFVRFMYEYCTKHLNGIIDPMTAYAINTINDRSDYETKQDDIAVVIQAGHVSATKNYNEDLVAALDESYKKIMMGAMFGGGKMPPALDSEVDENRLKQALYFYPEKALTKERIGEKAQIDGKKLYCNFIVENGRKDTELTYDVTFSLEKKFDNCDSLTFTEEEITGSSNMVGGGMIRSISADQTKMEVAGKMHIDNEEYRAFFNVTIDIPYNQVHQFNSVEIIVNEVKEIEDYTVVSVSFIFSPYDEEFSGDEDDDGAISFSSRGSLGSFLDSNNEDDYDEEDYEEPLDESEEYADVLDEDEFDYDCIEFDGKCSAYVKFDDGRSYIYNNENGHIAIGDKVTVGGKLAGQIGTVTSLEEYKYDSFMQKITKNYGKTSVSLSKKSSSSQSKSKSSSSNGKSTASTAKVKTEVKEQKSQQNAELVAKLKGIIKTGNGTIDLLHTSDFGKTFNMNHCTSIEVTSCFNEATKTIIKGYVYTYNNECYYVGKLQVDTNNNTIKPWSGSGTYNNASGKRWTGVWEKGVFSGFTFDKTLTHISKDITIYSDFDAQQVVYHLGENAERNAKLKKEITSTYSSTVGGCYVATCVYGSYDCPEVWTLRRYRDNVLGSTWYGRAFIRTYYAISPIIVKLFGKTKWFKKMWKGKLDRMVKKLEDNGFENTPYQDKEW